jgi:uncharacterized membrane protein
MTPRIPPRIQVVDAARTTALAAMVVFHFVFDLELFGHLPAGTSMHGLWWWWARATASGFLLLVGISLWLAHGRGIRWHAFWRRWMMVAGAAALVSVATRIGLGDPWVRFGILHMIAAGSLLALPFLRLPWWVSAVAAAAVALAPGVLRNEALNGGWLLWLGLGTSRPSMMDYLPVLPWLAPILAGVALARLLPWERLDADTPLLRRLAWPGRHSLAIYLLHQPALIGLVWVGTRLAG